MIRKWFRLLVLTSCLIITDQFFKIAARYLTPENQKPSSKISVLYEETHGWIQRDSHQSLGDAAKVLFLSQNGMLTLLIALVLLSMFHKSQRALDPAHALPYACVLAAIGSLWVDNIGVWTPQSLNIHWLHIQEPVKLNLSWAQIYLFLGILIFWWRVRRNEIVQ